MALSIFSASSGYPFRILVILLIPVIAHLMVILIRRLSGHLMKSLSGTAPSKARSVASLATSTLVFVLYFSAVGFVLKEFGISLTAYLASASVIGLAIGFGSQGLVQDVVTGLTLIFSDLIDIDDMVEISGQTGLVKRIGMRFTELDNHLGARVYIPNRTITNVVSYPVGSMRCYLDVTIQGGTAHRAEEMRSAAARIVAGVHEQLKGLFTAAPQVVGPVTTRTGKTYLRIECRIWPGQQVAVESRIKPEMLQEFKSIDPVCADWMFSMTCSSGTQTFPVGGAAVPKK